MGSSNSLSHHEISGVGVYLLS